MSLHLVTNHVSTGLFMSLIFVFLTLRRKKYSSVSAANTIGIHRDPLNSQISTIIPQLQIGTLDPNPDLPLWGRDVVGTLIENFTTSFASQPTDWVPNSLSLLAIVSTILDLHGRPGIGVWILKTCYISTSLALVLFLDVATLVLVQAF